MTVPEKTSSAKLWRPPAAALMFDSMRALLTLTFIFLLSGCWLGPALYTEAEARIAIPQGVYRAVNPNGEAESRVVSISMRPSGMTRVADQRDRELVLVGFVPLDAEGRDFVGWFDLRGGEESEVYHYALLRRLGDGDYLFVMPNCNETEAIAQSAGATVNVPERGPKNCAFDDRASLEAALRQLRPNSDRLTDGMVRLTRVSGGRR